MRGRGIGPSPSASRVRSNSVASSAVIRDFPSESTVLRQCRPLLFIEKGHLMTSACAGPSPGHDWRDVIHGDDHSRRPPPGPDRPGRRWSGDVRQHRAEARRAAKSGASTTNRSWPGFAGSAADSFALFSRFEAKLEQYRGNLERSAVELARDWRSDRLLRRLEAMLIVADQIVHIPAVGHRRPDRARRRHRGRRLRRAVCAGRGAGAGATQRSWTPRHIAEEAMAIAGEICIYTNPNLTIEEL